MCALLVSSCELTLAGISVVALRWSPGQVVVEIIALFTVQSFGVVVAHTPAVNLIKRWDRKL